jgi:hypothetical protein
LYMDGFFRIYRLSNALMDKARSLK